MTDHSNKNQAGFTIIELMIATLIFSVILLLISYAVLQIGRTYSKGLVQSRVQETARSVITQFSESIQFGGSNIVTPATPFGATPTTFCINNYRYTYVLDKMVVSAPPNSTQHESYHALVVDNQPGNCGTAHDFSTPIVANARELLSPNMRLAELDISQIGSGLYSITIRVVAGGDDVLSSDRQSCTSDRSGSQFCAFSELTTTVQKRIGNTSTAAVTPPSGALSIDLQAPANVTQNSPITLTWSVTNGVQSTNCTASGAWTGPKALNGPETRSGDSGTIGVKTYTLTCINGTDATSQVSKSVSVNVYAQGNG